MIVMQPAQKACWIFFGVATVSATSVLIWSVGTISSASWTLIGVPVIAGLVGYGEGQMHVREIQTSEIEAARVLLADNGWAHRVADPAAFRRLVANSQRAIVAVVDGTIVGFARAICDDISNGYLSMVVVEKQYRRRGVGRALVRAVMGSDPRITWVLRAGRSDELPFFEKLGFVSSTVAMERNRASSSDTCG